MATLDDYNANVVDLVSCLVEDALKELNNMSMDMATKREIKEAKEYVLKRGLATILFIGADHGRYGAMKNQMQQNMAMGTNNYPKSIDETMNILNTFTKTNKNNYAKKIIIKLKEQKLHSLKQET